MNPDHLVLVVEPEAAAIYCQRLNQSGGVATFCTSPSSFRVPERFMMVDIGGGTVDITVHDVVGGNTIETLGIPQGSSWGGTAVNREFAAFLAEIVNDKAKDDKKDRAFNRYLTEKEGNAAYLSHLLYEEFSVEKETFGMMYDKNPDDEICIQLPFTFYNTDEIKHGLQLLEQQRKQQRQLQQNPVPLLDNNTLYFKPSSFENFFTPAMQHILDFITAAIAQNTEIKMIYLVGGFGGCKYVYDKISAGLDAKYGKDTIKVIVPENHKLAVVFGAAFYGRHPEFIQTRKVDATYGISVNIPYDADDHLPHYRYYDEEGDEICCNAFMTFVANGQSIHYSDILVATLYPECQSAHSITIPIYGTPKKQLSYFLDEDDKQQARELARCSIDLPNDDFLARTQREFKLLLDFSSTEVQAQVIYMDTKKVAKVAIDFLSVQSK